MVGCKVAVSYSKYSPMVVNPPPPHPSMEISNDQMTLWNPAPSLEKVMCMCTPTPTHPTHIHAHTLSLGYLSNSRNEKGKLIVERFDREGLHQLQNFHGRNVLLLTSLFCYVNCSDTPEKVCCRSMNLYHITHTRMPVCAQKHILTCTHAVVSCMSLVLWSHFYTHLHR